MRRVMKGFVLALALVCLVQTFGSRTEAITHGFVDTTNAFPNVGAFIVRAPTGRIFPICSGTLIAPRVFLTASHCTAFFEDGLAPLGFTAFVSFDNPIHFGSMTIPSTNLIQVQTVVTNPNFSRQQSDPGDIAVLILPTSSTTGITPATLPTFGLLNQLGHRHGLGDAVFTAVGYGVQNRVVGQGPPFFENLNPVPRMFAFSGFNALTPAWLRLSQNPSRDFGGTCFGDSGGPNFLTVQGTRILVSGTVTGDAVCRSTSVTYRLDTLPARNFLGQFVTLP